ncbi:uncharacterized protein ACNS7B_009248 [Menidia menidia]
MGNYRTLLKSQGCPELSVNSLKSNASISVSPAARIKKPRRAEAKFYPSFPLGETQESMEKERIELLAAIKRRNNDRVIAEKMARTFAYRRQEVVNEEPGIEDFKDRWPALFQQKEINAEFQRLMALPLEQTFLAQLDRHSSQLIKVIQAKGGATRAKMAGIMRTYDEVQLLRGGLGPNPPALVSQSMARSQNSEPKNVYSGGPPRQGPRTLFQAPPA